MAGGYGYIAQGAAFDFGFASVDISDPDTVVLLDLVLHPGYGVNVALHDHYAYVAADNSGGLFVIDIEDPANMSFLGTCWSENTYGIAVVGNYAYVVIQSGLRVLDLANPADPVIIGSCAGQAFCRNLTVRDNLVYVVGGGLEIFDISDPTVPVSVSFSPLPGFARDIVLWSDFAYVAADTAGLRVFDISDSSAPVEVGYYNTPGKAWGLTADQNIIYLADSSRFGVYEFTPPPDDIDVERASTALPTEFALLPVYPNPFNATTTIGFAVPQASRVTLRACDLLGREVATIADREFGAGWQQVPWTCEPCASGMYLIVMTAAGTRFSQKALLMR